MPRFSSLCLFAIVAVYWMRVLKMAVKSRRRAESSAHLIPPEPLGRRLRLVWVPTVVLWIAIPANDAFTSHRHRLDEPAALRWTAVCIALAALAATWACWRKMGRQWRMGIDPNEANPLIVTGPWAYVRHPIYALSSLLMLATFLGVPNAAMAVVAVIHLSLLHWEAIREERHLLDVHGAAYHDYCRHVGRFLPKHLHAYRPMVHPSHP